MKFCLFPFILLISFSTYSQVYKSRAVLVTITRAGDMSVRERCNFLIVYNTDEKRIYFYNPDKNFDIIKMIGSKPLEGHEEYTNVSVSFIDNEGKKCYGSIFISKEGISGLNIFYDKIQYSYVTTPLTN